MDLPYTVRETFNNYPYNPRGYVWADANLTLQPHTYRFYSLDLINENNSLIYVKVEEATNPLVFMIEGPLGYGFNNNKTIVRLRMSPITPPESPFEYFWVPPVLGAWDFIFDNPYDTTTNVTVKILDYRYNVEW